MNLGFQLIQTNISTEEDGTIPQNLALKMSVGWKSSTRLLKNVVLHKRFPHGKGRKEEMATSRAEGSTNIHHGASLFRVHKGGALLAQAGFTHTQHFCSGTLSVMNISIQFNLFTLMIKMKARGTTICSADKRRREPVDSSAEYVSSQCPLTKV